MKTKVFLLSAAILPLAVSCGTAGHATFSDAKVEQVAKFISCDIDGERLLFPISNSGPDALSFADWPVFSKDMDEEDLAAYNGEAKRKGMPRVDMEGLDKWNKLCDRKVNKSIARRAQKLFTIPGLMTAYVADSIGLDALRPKPQLFIHYFGASQDVLKEARGAEDIILEYEDYTKPLIRERLTDDGETNVHLAYRSVKKASKVYAVTDVVYLDGGKMLYLLYLIDDGRSHYTRNTRSGVRELAYDFRSVRVFAEWDIGNWQLVSQYIRQYCDHMTFSICHAKDFGWQNVR